MDSIDLTKKQLLDRIKDLEMLNKELLKEKEQQTRLEYAWTGNLGHWYWNIKSNEVTFDPLKVTTLGYDKSENPEHVTYQFFTDKLHPDDYQRTMDSMLAHMYGNAEVCEAEYRIQTKDGNYKWYYDRGKATQFDESGKPLFLAGIVFDITEEKELQLELEHDNRRLLEISLADGLTNIGNHRALIQYLQAAMAESNRKRTPLTIAIFDVDDFKKVNDRQGHVCGDRVLIDLATIIKNNIRDTDLAGRYGGEEFMVIFSGADLATASNVAERIIKAVEEHSFSEGVTLTMSGGLKQYEGENLTDLIRAADAKLYESKRNGKNQITL
ncbi:MAG: sensor domain-containing diguanylate cyclase [Limnochordia bacterium]|nr:sensor domain-containing diguanylate cyclase [Limnochordia bacterium]